MLLITEADGLGVDLLNFFDMVSSELKYRRGFVYPNGKKKLRLKKSAGQAVLPPYFPPIFSRAT